MRLCFALFLSLVFACNAAFAGIADICDAADHMPRGEVGSHLHMGHHSHDDAASQDDGDPLKTSPSASGHCHAHGASASVVSGFDQTPSLPCGTQVLVPLPSAALVSITPTRLERPPRVSRA